MNTDVKSLLDIMRLRSAMQKSGIINPSNEVRIGTSLLVEKLSTLGLSELIEVEILSSAPVRAKYILKSTREVLAEIGN